MVKKWLGNLLALTLGPAPICFAIQLNTAASLVAALGVSTWKCGLAIKAKANFPPVTSSEKTLPCRLRNVLKEASLRGASGIICPKALKFVAALSIFALNKSR